MTGALFAMASVGVRVSLGTGQWLLAIVLLVATYVAVVQGVRRAAAVKEDRA